MSRESGYLARGCIGGSCQNLRATIDREDYFILLLTTPVFLL